MKSISFLIMSVIIGAASASAGPVIDMTGPRTLRVEGVILGNAIDLAHKVERMSSDSSAPIDLLINSPGGSVEAGLQLVEAIHIAQGRGVTVRCAVSTLAASMAFIILNECSERYALSNSLLLFHPARAMLMFAVIKADDARKMSEDLEAVDNFISEMLEEGMGIVTAQQKAWYNYHFSRETLWTAARLSHEVPNSSWIMIVSDIKAKGGLFGNENAKETAEGIKNFIEQRSNK
jgi:ATP-dependent protease ClpP protease subunit